MSYSFFSIVNTIKDKVGARPKASFASSAALYPVWQARGLMLVLFVVNVANAVVRGDLDAELGPEGLHRDRAGGAYVAAYSTPVNKLTRRVFI